MTKGMRFAIIRHLISMVIVVSLCAFYYKNTGRIFVWLFLPISLIPLLITFWDRYWQQKEDIKEEFNKKKIQDMPNAEERNLK